MTNLVSSHNFSTYNPAQFPDGFNCTQLIIQGLNLPKDQFKIHPITDPIAGMKYGEVPYHLRPYFEAIVPKQIKQECCEHQTRAFTAVPYGYCRSRLMSLKATMHHFMRSVFGMFDGCHTIPDTSLSNRVEHLKFEIKALYSDLTREIKEDENSKPWNIPAIQPTKSQLWPSWYEKYGIPYDPMVKNVIAAGQ